MSPRTLFVIALVAYPLAVFAEPTVETPIVNPIQTSEGLPTYFSISGAFSDPENELPFTAVIQWGDGETTMALVGTAVPFDYAFGGYHTYAQSGTYAVAISVADRNGGTGVSVGTNVTVGNEAPNVGAPTVNPARTIAGESTDFSVSGTFIDPAGALDQDYTALIQWGDGDTSAATVSGDTNPFSYDFAGNRHYGQSGSHDVTVSVTDKDGDTGTSPATRVSVSVSVSISDITVDEGNSGTTSAEFTVYLSSPNPVDIVLHYETVDGSAAAPEDYTAVANGILKIPAGQTTASIHIVVNGDSTTEADETFSVNLTRATNATIARRQGLGTITNDDAQ